MKYDEVMQLAKDIHEEGLFRFVAAIESKAVAAEREACAREAERFLLTSSGAVWEPKHFCEGIAATIRGRGG